MTASPGCIGLCPRAGQVAGLQRGDGRAWASTCGRFPRRWPWGHLWAVTSEYHFPDLNSWSPCLPARLPAQCSSRPSAITEPPKASVTRGSSQLHHVTISRNTSVMCTQRICATAGAAHISPLSSPSYSSNFFPISARDPHLCMFESLPCSCPVWQVSWKRAGRLGAGRKAGCRQQWLCKS